MVNINKATSLIIFVGLLSMSCTAYKTVNDDEDNSVSEERRYNIREFFDLLINKRAPVDLGSSCIKCAKVCVSKFAELGQSGTVVDAISLISENAKEKAAFCRLYERVYPNGKFDQAAYNEIINSVKPSMTASDKATCVLKGLKGDFVNACLAIAEKIL